MKPRTALLTMAFVALGMSAGRAADFEAGGAGADIVFVEPVGAGIGGPGVRAAVSVEPVDVRMQIGRAVLLPLELMVSAPLGQGQAEISRAKAQLLRLSFSHVVPVDVLTLYRDLDRGIQWGVDLVGIHVPIRVTDGGAIVLQPGIELGIRHVAAPVDETAFHASFVIEGRAAAQLVEDWLSTGILARIRYDATGSVMRGFEEGAMGYLSLLLDPEHRLYARIYGGLEHQQSRERLGLPTLEAFTGFGIFGNFGTRR